MKRFTLAAISGVGLAVACAMAGPLDKSKVDAGAKWLVHVDVEKTMGSTTGKFISEHRANLDLGPLEEFKKKTGLDAFKDIKDVTVFGMTDDPEKAVAFIHGTDKIEEAVDRLMAEDKTVERVELAGRAVYKWTEDGSARYGYLKRGGDVRVFVVSKMAEHLERALKVMDGEAESLATVKEGAMARSPRAGSMMYVAVRDLDKTSGRAPKMLRTAQELNADLGEDAEGLYGEVHVTAGAAEDVKNIADFARGLIALGRMASQGDADMKDLARVIDGIKIETSGTELTASFRIGRELLSAALSELKSHNEKPPKGPAVIEKTSQEEKTR